MNDEIIYRLIKTLEANPNLSQRELAREVGISLGKVNHCLKELIEKGLLKVRNFRNSDSKLRYAYVLTPKGLREKVRITQRYLARRMAEYEALKEEIERLRAEIEVKE